MRETNRWFEERKDNNGNSLCLIPTCNKLRQKHKITSNTRNYCEDHTYLDIRKINNWQVIRETALKRDNFSCVQCGNKPTIKSEEGIMLPNSGALIGDHIIPIALSGNQWDLNNIQTLCIECNKIKTAQDMKEITERRRNERIQSPIKQETERSIQSSNR